MAPERTYISTDEVIWIEPVFKFRKRRTLVDNFTPISEVPRDWLQIIEPKIKRLPAENPKGGCWVWQGAVDGGGHPVMMTTHLDGSRGQRRVARWVASFFYEFPKWVEVTHHCRNITCLRPSHLELHSSRANQRIPGPITHLGPSDISVVRPGIDDKRKKLSVSTDTREASNQQDNGKERALDDSWVTVQEAIKLLGIGRASFYRYREKGLIIPPPCRSGRQLFYDRTYINNLARDMKPYSGPDRDRGRGYGWGV